jgi:aryl-alcohol dehydrogenase-like predicted oxidoreductase
MKLAIGTVQFGLSYGINNQSGRVMPDEARKILQLASQSGLKTLDTAIDYGESENTLGEVGVADWDVVTKLPAIPQNCPDVANWLHAHVESSCHRLKINQLHGLLLHRPNQLLGEFGKPLIHALEKAKNQGYIRKIGVSIYNPNELDSLNQIIPLEIVQAPLNLLDRRLVDSGWARKLKEQGTELHVRSAFLQGLLLMSPEQRPKKFARFDQIWTEWSRWLSENQISALQACLGYVTSVPEVDKIVVGVDGVTQLQEIIAAARTQISGFPNWQQPIDSNLTNPAQWSAL